MTAVRARSIERWLGGLKFELLATYRAAIRHAFGGSGCNDHGDANLPRFRVVEQLFSWYRVVGLVVNDASAGDKLKSPNAAWRSLRLAVWAVENANAASHGCDSRRFCCSAGAMSSCIIDGDAHIVRTSCTPSCIWLRVS